MAIGSCTGLGAVAMECPPPVRREDGETEWAEVARKYLHVVSSGDEAAAVRATLEIKRLACHAPDSAMRVAVRALVGLLARSPPPRLQAAASQALCSVVRVDGGRFAAEVVDAGFFPVAQGAAPGGRGGAPEDPVEVPQLHPDLPRD